MMPPISDERLYLGRIHHLVLEVAKAINTLPKEYLLNCVLHKQGLHVHPQLSLQKQVQHMNQVLVHLPLMLVLALYWSNRWHYSPDRPSVFAQDPKEEETLDADHVSHQWLCPCHSWTCRASPYEAESLTAARVSINQAQETGKEH